MTRTTAGEPPDDASGEEGVRSVALVIVLAFIAGFGAVSLIMPLIMPSNLTDNDTDPDETHHWNETQNWTVLNATVDPSGYIRYMCYSNGTATNPVLNETHYIDLLENKTKRIPPPGAYTS